MNMLLNIALVVVVVSIFIAFVFDLVTFIFEIWKE